MVETPTILPCVAIQLSTSCQKLFLLRCRYGDLRPRDTYRNREVNNAHIHLSMGRKLPDKCRQQQQYQCVKHTQYLFQWRHTSEK